MGRINVRILLCVALLMVFASVLMAQDYRPEPPAWWLNKAKKVGPDAKGSMKQYTNAQLLASFELAGDEILRNEHTDGGWGLWRVPSATFTEDLTAPGFYNQYGINARGLLLLSTKVPAQAAAYIGDGTAGASRTKEYLMNQPLYYYFDVDTNTWKKSYYYSTDRLFLCEYTKYTGDPAPKAKALSEWAWVKANVTKFASPQTLAQAFVQDRANIGYFNQGYGYGLVLWDIGGYAEACQAMGDHTYAQGLLDIFIIENNWTPAPADPFYNTGSGYSKNIFNNFLKRWDDANTSTTDIKQIEWIFISAAGQLLQAFNAVDSARYRPQIEALRTRLINDCQITIVGHVNFGAYAYGKLGWYGLECQDNGYACMGMRHIGEVVSGQKATQALINTQLTTTNNPFSAHANYLGGWVYDTPPTYDFFQECVSEAVQGMWEISEGEQKPWVTIVVNPPGNHINQVPVTYALFDIQNDPAAIKVEYSTDDGSTWIPTTNVLGALSGLTTSQTGINHSLTWLSYADGINSNASCKLKITARDMATADGWGSPSGVTDIFTVLNGTIPVELSVFSLE